MYRGFYKNLNNLAGNSISSADLRIKSMNIKRDILTLTISEFGVVKIPPALTEGNVFGVYDDYGQTVYLGIIKSLEGNIVQCEDIIALFNDEWRYFNPAATTIESKIRNIITDKLGNNTDTYLASIFSAFNVTTISSTTGQWESKDGSINLMDYLFDIYKNYGILLNINIAFNAINPTIQIGIPSFPIIKLSNNTHVLRNFAITTETQEKNKLEIYNADGSELRATYFATSSEITTNPAALNRLPKIKTKIVFSDDDLADIVANNLTSDMFNHKITVELVLKNKLYDFNDFHLAQNFEIYYNGKIYESILTGYSIAINDEGQADKVKLTFGKVRQTLESKIQAISAEVFSKKVDNTILPDPYEPPTFTLAWSGACKFGTTITCALPNDAEMIICRWLVNTYHSTLAIPIKLLTSSMTRYIVSDDAYYAGGEFKLVGTTLTYKATANKNSECYLKEIYYI